MDLATQIGGKYHPDNKSLFKLKQKLKRLGVRVAHPLSDTFDDLNNTASGYDPAVFSMYNIKVDFYESIRESDLHIVSNVLGTNHGYIGKSAAREILYAMLKHKPIVLLYPPKVKPSLDPFTRTIIERHVDRLHVCNLLELTDDELRAYLKATIAQKGNYGLSHNEATLIRSRVRTFFRELTHA